MQSILTRRYGINPDRFGAKQLKEEYEQALSVVQNISNSEDILSPRKPMFTVLLDIIYEKYINKWTFSFIRNSLEVFNERKFIFYIIHDIKEATNTSKENDPPLSLSDLDKIWMNGFVLAKTTYESEVRNRERPSLRYLPGILLELETEINTKLQRDAEGRKTHQTLMALLSNSDSLFSSEENRTVIKPLRQDNAFLKTENARLEKLVDQKDEKIEGLEQELVDYKAQFERIKAGIEETVDKKVEEKLEELKTQMAIEQNKQMTEKFDAFVKANEETTRRRNSVRSSYNSSSSALHRELSHSYTEGTGESTKKKKLFRVKNPLGSRK